MGSTDIYLCVMTNQTCEIHPIAFNLWSWAVGRVARHDRPQSNFFRFHAVFGKIMAIVCADS